MTEQDRELLLQIFARVLFGSAGIALILLTCGERQLLGWALSVAFATGWLYFTDSGRK